MQQHPIPQNVTAYEFHLIGNMTVKQFLELGAGIGVGVVIYSTNLPMYIKFGLIIFAVGAGAALAFLPFDGRPLDKMVIVFLKAVYSPTQFIWQKAAQIPGYFTYESKRPNLKPESETQKVRKNLREYLSTLPETQNPDLLDAGELKYVASINALFQSTPNPTSISATEGTNYTSPSIRVRKMKPESEVTQINPRLVRTIQSVSMITVPENKPIKIDEVSTSIKATAQQTTYTPVIPLPQSEINGINQPLASAASATQNRNLPFPSLPTTPNTLVGMVIDPLGHIVENAIIEVRDQHNVPVRALKSNRLGQFLSATPLTNGAYQIEVEKDGLKFDIVNINLTGQILEPLEIRAKS
jgi:hypothetical protein